jgi:Fic family protein
MLDKNYKITTKIVSNIVRFEVAKTLISKVELNNRISKELPSKIKSTSIFYIARMMGVELTIKDAQKVIEGKKIVTQDERGQLINNFKNVLEFTRSSGVDKNMRIDLNLLLHINKILITDWKQIWEAKLRTSNELPDPTLEDWFPIVQPYIPNEDIQYSLLTLLDWYNDDMDEIPTLLKISIFVYQLLIIQPFTNLNKFTIIAIADLLLFKNGYCDNSNFNIPKNFASSGTTYITIAQRSMIENEFTTWIELFTLSMAKEMEAAHKEIATEVQLASEKEKKQPFLDLNKRQLKILKYLQTIPTVKREDYVHMLEVSSMTAFRDLNELVDKKLIKIQGKGRGTKYMLYTR